MTLPDDRRGILGQGSVLMLTSVADRTSPVHARQVGDGSAARLAAAAAAAERAGARGDQGGRRTAGCCRCASAWRSTARTRRARSCHRVIDPLGLALENFDVTGAWRIKDNGVPVDATGELYDGTQMDGPAGLRAGAAEAQGRRSC